MISHLKSTWTLGILIALSGCVDYKSPMVVRHKAMLAEQRGDYEAALKTREQFFKDSPDYYFISEVYYEQGMTYLDHDRLEEALEYFNKAIEDDPEFLQAYIRRCEVNSRLGNHEAAISDGNRAIELSVSDTNLSRAFLHQGNSQAALQHRNRAMIKWQMSLLLDPNQMPALTQLFNFYIDSGEYNEALQLIEGSLKQNDRFAQKQLMYSQILTHLNRRDEAEQALKRAHELNLGDEMVLPATIDEFPKWDIAEIEVAPLRHEVARPVTPPETKQSDDSVQAAAMQVAKDYLTAQGIRFTVDSQTSNQLHCEEGDLKFDVLIKQTPASQGQRFQLSQEELNYITSQNPPRGMIIVADVAQDPQSGKGDLRSGRVAAFARSWRPDPERLNPVLFEYEIPVTRVEE